MAPRTQAELRDDLQSRGVPDDVAERVLARFVEVGLVNDADYARMWVQSRHRAKGEARTVMRQQLRRKGVDEALIDQALTSVTGADEAERARALVQARMRTMAGLDDPTRRRRLSAMLQRRGYSASVAMAVVREVLGSGSVAGT